MPTKTESAHDDDPKSKSPSPNPQSLSGGSPPHQGGHHEHHEHHGHGEHKDEPFKGPKKMKHKMYGSKTVENEDEYRVSKQEGWEDDDQGGKAAGGPSAGQGSAPNAQAGFGSSGAQGYAGGSASSGKDPKK